MPSMNCGRTIWTCFGIPGETVMLVFVFDGHDIQITNMFDVDGDETDDPEMACSVVGQLDNGRWCSMKVVPSDIVKRVAQ